MRGLRATAALSLLGVCAAAGAQTIVFAPRPEEALKAGSEVPIRWSGVPASAEEVELLLSLDAEHRVTLRLTDELSADASFYIWRVPNLTARRAALVLRIGVEGREIEGAASTPFEIIPDHSVPGESLRLRQGELWLADEDAATGGVPPLPAGLASREDSWTPATGETELVDSYSSRGPAARATRAARRSVLSLPVSWKSPSGFESVARAPLLLSLRI